MHGRIACEAAELFAVANGQPARANRQEGASDATRNVRPVPELAAYAEGTPAAAKRPCASRAQATDDVPRLSTRGGRASSTSARAARSAASCETLTKTASAAHVVAQRAAEALREELGESYPALLRVPVAFAVNRDYARAETVLADGDEVAFIPPIALLAFPSCASSSYLPTHSAILRCYNGPLT